MQHLPGLGFFDRSTINSFVYGFLSGASTRFSAAIDPPAGSNAVLILKDAQYTISFLIAGDQALRRENNNRNQETINIILFCMGFCLGDAFGSLFLGNTSLHRPRLR